MKGKLELMESVHFPIGTQNPFPAGADLLGRALAHHQQQQLLLATGNYCIGSSTLSVHKPAENGLKRMPIYGPSVNDLWDTSNNADEEEEAQQAKRPRLAGHQKREEQQQDAAQLRPSSFSIDWILQESLANREGSDHKIARKCENGGVHAANVQYFMGEHELSWTDGRRCRRVKSAATAKHSQSLSDKPRPKQPPLPSSSKVLISGQKQHICAECGKSYATSSNLSRHKQIHRPLDGPHAKKCPFCAKPYVSMPGMAMHLLTHLPPEEQHKCPTCDKLFSRAWLLRNHVRSRHTGERPFACGNCGKAFSDRSNLRAHLNTHNNEKHWRCEACGRAFALKSYLNKHLEQQHGVAADEGRRSREQSAGRSDMATLPSLCDDEMD